MQNQQLLPLLHGRCRHRHRGWPGRRNLRRVQSGRRAHRRGLERLPGLLKRLVLWLRLQRLRSDPPLHVHLLDEGLPNAVLVDLVRLHVLESRAELVEVELAVLLDRVQSRHQIVDIGLCHAEAALPQRRMQLAAVDLAGAVAVKQLEDLTQPQRLCPKFRLK